MDDAFRSFFERRLSPAAAGNGDADGHVAEPEAAARARLHLAACVLLLELAHADDEFSDIEQTHIEAVLRRHFDLDADTARELMAVADAERRSADDLHPFASRIRASYDQGQRTLLAEIMWGLILADGEVARHEARLLHRICQLLDLESGYLSEPGGGSGDQAG